MGIKTFEEYNLDVEQLFEVKSAFDAAVKMCKDHYGESIEDRLETVISDYEDTEYEDLEEEVVGKTESLVPEGVKLYNRIPLIKEKKVPKKQPTKDKKEDA